MLKSGVEWLRTWPYSEVQYKKVKKVFFHFDYRIIFFLNYKWKNSKIWILIKNTPNQPIETRHSVRRVVWSLKNQTSENLNPITMGPTRWVLLKGEFLIELSLWVVIRFKFSLVLFFKLHTTLWKECLVSMGWLGVFWSKFKFSFYNRN